MTAGRAWAQPQDDAALAELPKERVSPFHPEMREKVDEGPPLTLEQLHQEYSDLEAQATPRSGLGLFIGGLVPFQLMAVGLGADVYAIPRLRLSAFVSVGMSPTLNRESFVNGYVEASVGVAVLRSVGLTSVRLPEPPTRLKLDPQAPPRFQRGLVPRSHSLEVEAGILSGQYVLYECLADCQEPVQARRMRRAGSQLAVPFAGVRYVYFRWARSLKTPFRSAQRFQAAAQLLSRPINNPEPGLQDVRGRTIERRPVGGRVILQFPGVQRSPDSLAFSADLTVGYLPSPSDAIVQVSLVLF